MLRTLNNKFYAVVAMVLATFGIGYANIAYFLHHQSKGSDLVQQAIELKVGIATLNESFHKVRLWEKMILDQSDPESEKHFAEYLQQIRMLLLSFDSKIIDDDTKNSFKLILNNINRYEALIGVVNQHYIKEALLDTRLNSTFQSMISTVLQEKDSSLLRSLFSVAHFFISYQRTRDIEQYQALQIAVRSLESKSLSVEGADPRLNVYIKSFSEILYQTHETVNETQTTKHNIELVSIELTNNLSHASKIIEILIKESLHTSRQNRLNLQHIFLVTMLGGALFLLLILRLLKINIISPIASLSNIVSRVKNGDISARFHQSMKKKDEILELGLSFNNMLDSIEERDHTLLDYQQQLEEKIKELSKQKEEQEKLTIQLQRVEKMEAIGTLAGGVAHDLNNILSGLVSYPELLLLELPEDSPYRKPLTVIQDSGQRAVVIVQDLLTLARRGAAVQELTNLNTLIAEYLASPEGESLIVDYPQVTITTELHDKLFNIKGSKIHLLKTIMNLVTNGIESIQGIGTITIATENRYISQPIAGYDQLKEGDYAALIVGDTGQGISAEDLEHIFEPFFTRKKMGRSGSGLGLAVVWGTVKDHQGYIDVQSTESEGTTFSLYFPISREEVGEKILKQPIESFLGKGESVLVVDDAENQRIIAADLLKKLGYTVHTTESGEKAIAFLRTKKVDILILDMLMPPGIDGLETYQEIIRLYPQQKAIIASGYSETERVLEAQKLGVAAYIRKPYSLETIGLAVKNELDG